MLNKNVPKWVIVFFLETNKTVIVLTSPNSITIIKLSSLPKYTNHILVVS